jgi:hypothetical protein
MKKMLATAIAATLLVCAATVPAQAQPGARATLILKSGERINGSLVDMGADFTINTGGRDSHLPIADVAVIDFVGGGQGIPATETSKIDPSRHLVFKRGGASFFGRLVDITGVSPLVLIFDTQDGRVQLSSNEAGRIYLARWEGMPTGSGSGGSGEQPTTKPQPTPDGVAVAANVRWVDTGIQVAAGQMVTFNATGQVILSGDNNDTAGPAGAANGRVAERGAQMPGIAAGALIGRVGNAMPFGIGNQTQALRMPASGPLYLGVNDNNGTDNRGEYRVRINMGR